MSEHVADERKGQSYLRQQPLDRKLEVPPWLFQFLTGTSLQKSVNTTGKNVFELVKSPSLKVIC